MKVKKKGDEDNQRPIQVQKIETGLTYDYDFSQNTPQVIFKIPAEWGNGVTIEKSRNNEKVFLRESSDFLTDHQKTTYRFFKKGELIDEIEVLPPFDLVLTTDLNLAQLYSLNSKVKKIFIRHLELKQKAKLFIEDYKGLIMINEINSEDGSLQTYPLNQSAQPEQNGRSVGGFNLMINSGQGLLNLNLIAEAGGDGKPGKEPDEKLIGLSGREGTAAFFTASMTTCLNSELCIPILIYNCEKPSGKGFDGGQGLRGYAGTNAGHGGSVEKIEIENNASQLTLKKNFQIGSKGRGGKGASGGKGGASGLGGDGGEKDLLRFLGKKPIFTKLGKSCEPALPGEIGIRGETGVDGHDGQDGFLN